MLVLSLAFVVTTLAGGLLLSGHVAAAPASTTPDPAANNYCKPGQTAGQFVPGTTTPCIANDKAQNSTDTAASGKACNKDKCDLVTKYINPFINVGSGLAGILITISMVVGAIQMGSAGGDPGKFAKGRQRVGNAIGALVAFIFLWAVLNWLIPGGLA